MDSFLCSTSLLSPFICLASLYITSTCNTSDIFILSLSLAFPPPSSLLDHPVLAVSICDLNPRRHHSTLLEPVSCASRSRTDNEHYYEHYTSHLAATVVVATRRSFFPSLSLSLRFPGFLLWRLKPPRHPLRRSPRNPPTRYPPTNIKRPQGRNRADFHPLLAYHCFVVHAGHAR